MRAYSKVIIVLFLVLNITTNAISQDLIDHHSWNYAKFSFKINDKWSMNITPTYRFHKDLTEFQDVFVDYQINRKLYPGLIGGIMGRTFAIPGQKPRQFIWYILKYSMPDLIPGVNIGHMLRFHNGVDINEREDADFLRYKLTVSIPTLNKRINPFAVVEPFYQFNGVNKFDRWRYEIGSSIKANSDLKFFGFLRIEDFTEHVTDVNFYIWMVGFQYQFAQPIFATKK